MSLVIDQGKFGENSKFVPIFQSSYSAPAIFAKFCVLTSSFVDPFIVESLTIADICVVVAVDK